MIFKSGRKASPLTSLLDVILLILFAQNIVSSHLSQKLAEKKAKDLFETDIQKKDSRIKKLGEQLDETRANYNKDTTDKNDRITSLENDLNKTKNDLDIAYSKIKELKATLASNSFIISSLNEKYKNLNDEFFLEKEQNLTLKSNINSLSSELEKNKEENTRLVSENNDLKDKNKSLDSENNTLKEEIAKNKEENTKLVSENNDLKDKNKSLDSENNTLKEEIAKNKEENIKLVSENNDLKNKNKNLDSENNTLKEEIAKNKDENIKLVSLNNSLNDTNKKLDNENIKLKNDVDSKNEENKKLQKEMLDNTEINVALNTQIDELKRFVEENSKDLNEVEGATKLVTVRKILTSARALEQLKRIVTVVEVLLYEDKIVIRLNGFEENLNWPDVEELKKDKFDLEVVKDQCDVFRGKLSSLFDKAKENKNEIRLLLIPSGDNNLIPTRCWKFFKKMYDSGYIKDNSFIKNLQMPDNYIYIKEN